jgi:hypothetical protein
LCFPVCYQHMTHGPGGGNSALSMEGVRMLS